MNFSIDKQSLEELNLLGKFRHGSVFALFNKTQTRSGGQLLERIFTEPLTDPDHINHRTAVFSFFQDINLPFPFDSQEVTQMQEFVDASGGQGRISGYLNTLLKKGLAVLTRDERYKLLIQGIQSTIVTLKKCHALVIEISAMQGPFAGRVNEISQILDNAQLADLIETDIYKPMTVGRIAKYDYLLSDKLNSDIRNVLEFIAEVDVNIAVSQIAQANGLTYARALPKNANRLKAIDLKHPCIYNAVGNNIEMQEQSNVIFLTGANMAGKSTWMKTIGINMYLSHIGFPVAAQSMEFSVREGIYSSINVADNIALGYSHFYAEVVRVKDAADATASGKHLLLMFDELFKGTNVKDAYDGTLAVTSAFSEYVNCLFVVSTHIIEVGEALKDKSNIQFTYMPTVMNGNLPEYTYRLKKGITEDRQGMMIIRNEGIIELIGT